MQFLASNDVVMTTAFNGRIFAAQQSGAHIKPIWNGSIHAIDYWAVPRGSKNKDLAEDFIAFTLRPENQRKHTTQLGYGSLNLHTAALLDPALAAQLNTAPANMAHRWRLVVISGSTMVRSCRSASTPGSRAKAESVIGKRR